jgi:hypothetical protein
VPPIINMEPAAHRFDPKSAPAESNTVRWRLPDLLDFDYYVDRDEQALRADPAERKRLAERDRRLYRERIAAGLSAPEHSPKHRRQALRRWLALRRGAEDPQLLPLLPGAAFARGQRLVTILLGVLGFIAGVGVASALLQYEGDRPVNVSWYVFVLVILQVLLLLGTAAAWYGRRTRTMQTAVQDLSLISHMLKPLFGAAARWVQRQRLAHMPPDVRERAEARKGLLHGHFALYGAAAYLPMLIPAQLFGIGFNLGAILATLSLEWFTDLAFGWGSALNVQPGAIHAIAHLLALPWSWLFGEGLGVPTLEQVEGTRISLKDPLFIMQAEHLRSWRWFLVLALFTYGLLPRLVLLGLSALTVRRTLSQLPFTHQRTQSLYARMVTPQLETAGGSGHGPEMPIPAPLKPATTARAAPSSAPRKPDTTAAPQTAPARPSPVPERQQPAATARKQQPPGAPAPRVTPAHEVSAQPEPIAPPVPQRVDRKPAPVVAPAAKEADAPQPAPQPPTRVGAAKGIPADACVLLLHVDVADVLEPKDHERLQRLLTGLSGWRVATSATYGGGSSMARQALAIIEGANWQSPPARVALLADGSQPPITESLRFLRAVRAAAGEHAQLLLLLVGDPEGPDPLPPLTRFEFQDWQYKIDQLGDPYLRLEMLAGPAEEVD